MFPWLVWWAPTFELPFSGDVTQDIAPETDWYLGHAKQGDPSIERRVVEDVASYGKQLGILIDCVSELVASDAMSDVADKPSAQALKKLASDVDAVKSAQRGARVERARAAIDSLRETDYDAFRELIAEYGAMPPGPKS